MKALFHIKRLGVPVKEPGDVDLLMDGLRIKPPAGTAKKMAVGVLIGPVWTAFIKGKPFTIPYDKIVSMRLTYMKTSVVGPERPFIELSFYDEKGTLRTIAFAPFLQEGVLKRMFKTQEFYNELSRRIRATGRALPPTCLLYTSPSPRDRG